MNMTAAFIRDEYEEFVGGLCKPGADIKAELSPQQAHAWHMATGVAGEAGELLDAIKKWCVYQKKLDTANVLEELGDLEFFMAGMRMCLGISREEVLSHNTAKLKKRFADGYSNEAAQVRADKQ
jgi:NTP pyrophosphatase (non-canonical NTP hydrolase)